MSRETESRRLFGRGFYLTDEFMDLAKAHYLPDESRWADPEASPLLGEVPAGLAPAYIATAGFDPLRDEGEAYARKLAEAGVAVELAALPRPDPRLHQRRRRRPLRPCRGRRGGGPARGGVGRRSVDEGLHVVGQHLFDVRRGAGDADPGQQVRLVDAPA